MKKLYKNMLIIIAIVEIVVIGFYLSKSEDKIIASLTESDKEYTQIVVEIAFKKNKAKSITVTFDYSNEDKAKMAKSRIENELSGVCTQQGKEVILKSDYVNGFFEKFLGASFKNIIGKETAIKVLENEGFAIESGKK